MGTLGYAAMFEQFAPNELLKWSRMAEDAGFGSVMASDHFHPWTPSQGQSAFVWAWMGALGAQTSRVRFGPTRRNSATVTATASAAAVAPMAITTP